jgi:methionine-rich copper-binding protein CopC
MHPLVQQKRQTNDQKISLRLLMLPVVGLTVAKHYGFAELLLMNGHSKRLRLLLVVAAFLAMALVREAAAHAILFEATPARNSVVKGLSVAVRLRFNVRVDASRSRLALAYPGGSLHVLQVKPQQPPDVIAADVSNLPSGQYDLKWRVLASDGHMTQGDIPFAVK